MQVSSWFICLWPGLPRLWWRGDWRALFTAIAFALVLNLWLVASFLWTELLPAKVLVAGWVVTIAFWVLSLWQGRRAWAEIQSGGGERAPEDLFIQAQQEYLNRHWFEAEHLLRDLVRRHERDAEAQLLLATLYRRTHRLPEAEAQLDAVERLESAARWQLEIAQERRLIQRAQSEQSGEEPGMHQEQPGSEQEVGTAIRE